MNWADPKGLIEPAPNAVTFLGYFDDMPSGGKEFFLAKLESGKYALISEVPNASSKNMLKTFVVSEQLVVEITIAKIVYNLLLW